MPLQYFMPNAVLWAAFSIIVSILHMSAFTMIGPVISSVAPYRLRGMTGAVSGLYLFFVGAMGGAILSAGLDSAFGPRAAVLIITIPATVVGATMIIRSSHFIRNDLSLIVLELQEEREETRRQAADPESIPVLQLNHIDFSYGNVQVLFDSRIRGATRRSPGTARDKRLRKIDRTPSGGRTDPRSRSGAPQRA